MNVYFFRFFNAQILSLDAEHKGIFLIINFKDFNKILHDNLNKMILKIIIKNSNCEQLEKSNRNSLFKKGGNINFI